MATWKGKTKLYILQTKIEDLTRIPEWYIKIIKKYVMGHIYDIFLLVTNRVMLYKTDIASISVSRCARCGWTESEHKTDQVMLL